MWSKDINKAFCADRAKHYPGHKAVAQPGWLRGEPVWLVEVALHCHDEGHVCPYCGGSPDEGETLATVRYEDGYGTKPYVNTEHQCGSCRKWWTIRSRTISVESVLEFTPPRNAISGLKKF